MKAAIQDDQCMKEDQTDIECGNGVVEKGEECDCGRTAAECQKKDRCCMSPQESNPCHLRPPAICSPYTSGCCTAECKHAPPGTQCSDTADECMMPNNCTGKSAECPPAIQRPDGITCSENTRVCISGECSRSVCEHFAIRKECLCMDGPQNLCYVCCLADNNEDDCIPFSDFELQGIPPGMNFTKPAGYPCGVGGICDTNGVCTPEMQQLQKPAKRPIEPWHKRYWYILLIAVFLGVLCICTICPCWNYDRKDNPGPPPQEENVQPKVGAQQAGTAGRAVESEGTKERMAKEKKGANPNVSVNKNPPKETAVSLKKGANPNVSGHKNPPKEPVVSGNTPPPEKVRAIGKSQAAVNLVVKSDGNFEEHFKPHEPYFSLDDSDEGSEIVNYLMADQPESERLPEGNDVLPVGKTTEKEDIPAPKVKEDIPVPKAVDEDREVYLTARSRFSKEDAAYYLPHGDVYLTARSFEIEPPKQHLPQSSSIEEEISIGEEISIEEEPSNQLLPQSRPIEEETPNKPLPQSRSIEEEPSNQQLPQSLMRSEKRNDNEIISPTAEQPLERSNK